MILLDETMNEKRRIFITASVRIYVASVYVQINTMCEHIEELLRIDADLDGFTESEIEDLSETAKVLRSVTGLIARVDSSIMARVKGMISEVSE